jgi:hypothetical protein
MLITTQSTILKDSTVLASYNRVRCLIHPTDTAELQPMIDGVIVGWCFIEFPAIGAMCVPLSIPLWLRGLAWQRGMMSE